MHTGTSPVSLSPPQAEGGLSASGMPSIQVGYKQHDPEEVSTGRFCSCLGSPEPKRDPP